MQVSSFSIMNRYSQFAHNKKDNVIWDQMHSAGLRVLPLFRIDRMLFGITRLKKMCLRKLDQKIIM